MGIVNWNRIHNPLPWKFTPNFNFKMNKALLVLTILSLCCLLASAKSSDRQTCKVCAGKSDFGTCKNDKDLGDDTVCPKDKHVSCYKKVHASGSITRGCTDITKEGCEKETKNGKEEETCICSGNLCNGSQITDASKQSMLLGVIFVAVASRLF